MGNGQQDIPMHRVTHPRSTYDARLLQLVSSKKQGRRIGMRRHMHFSSHAMTCSACPDDRHDLLRRPSRHATKAFPTHHEGLRVQTSTKKEGVTDGTPSHSRHRTPHIRRNEKSATNTPEVHSLRGRMKRMEANYAPKLSKLIMSSSTPREWRRSMTVVAIIGGPQR